MKKLMILIMLVILVGCTSNEKQSEITRYPEPEMQYFVKFQPRRLYTENRTRSWTDTKSLLVDKFEYDGHQYIVFYQGYRMGVVHDPDCSCHK